MDNLKLGMMINKYKKKYYRLREKYNELIMAPYIEPGHIIEIETPGKIRTLICEQCGAVFNDIKHVDVCSMCGKKDTLEG